MPALSQEWPITLHPLGTLILRNTQAMAGGRRPRVHSEALLLDNLAFMEDKVSKSLQRRERIQLISIGHSHQYTQGQYPGEIFAPTCLRVLAPWSGLSLTSPFHLLFSPGHPSIKVSKHSTEFPISPYSSLHSLHLATWQMLSCDISHIPLYFRLPTQGFIK